MDVVRTVGCYANKPWITNDIKGLPQEMEGTQSLAQRSKRAIQEGAGAEVAEQQREADLGWDKDHDQLQLEEECNQGTRGEFEPVHPFIHFLLAAA